jgi:Dullard-like phosphatase family protein
MVYEKNDFIKKDLSNVIINSLSIMGHYLSRRLNPIKKLLVLDLDETLVHTDISYSEYPSVTHINFETYYFKINDIYCTTQVRPHMFDFLTYVSQYYDIAIFTASKKYYADTILNAIDPDNKWFKQRYYYHNCTLLSDDGYPIKDLAIMNRKLKYIVLVDDSVSVYQDHIPNLIQIQGWTGYQHDQKLLDLCLILNEIAFSKDVRKCNLNNLFMNC